MENYTIQRGLLFAFSALFGTFAQAQKNGFPSKPPHPGTFITVDSTFLFEKSMASNTVADVIYQQEGLLLNRTVTLESYKSFFCIFSESKEPAICKSKHICKILQKELDSGQKSVSLQLLYLIMNENRIPLLTPFYRSHYLPCKLKMDLYYMGLRPHRIPLFMDSTSYQNYRIQHGKNYKIKNLPTYLITKVY